MVRLTKALYGHPDSGSFWEKHCDENVKAVGFRSVGSEWPSLYVHDVLKLTLVVYVDAFKLAGPKHNIAKGWSLLRSKLDIEPETTGTPSRMRSGDGVWCDVRWDCRAKDRF